MNEIIIIAVSIIGILIVKLALNVKIRKMFALNNEKNSETLEKISEKFPEDKEICNDILKQIKAKNVKVKIDKESYNCFYAVATNSITIGKFKQDIIKIQTIAHECIHATQNKSTLWTNFILSNIYNVYFLVILVLTLFNKVKFTNVLMYVLIMLAIIKFIIRAYLENDAMIRAKYVSKEYLDSKEIFTEKEKEELINKYEQVNKLGIPFYNFYLFSNEILKIIVYCIISLI